MPRYHLASTARAVALTRDNGRSRGAYSIVSASAPPGDFGSVTATGLSVGDPVSLSASAQRTRPDRRESRLT